MVPYDYARILYIKTKRAFGNGDIWKGTGYESIYRTSGDYTVELSAFREVGAVSTATKVIKVRTLQEALNEASPGDSIVVDECQKMQSKLTVPKGVHLIVKPECLMDPEVEITAE